MKNYLKILKIEPFETIFKTFSIILTLLYIIFIFWNRLINKRGKHLLDGNYTSLQLIIFTLLFLLSFFMIIITLRTYFFIKKKGKLKQLIEKVLVSAIGNFMVTYILNAPQILYEWLYNYITIRPLIEKIGAKIWNMDPYKYCKYLLFFIYFLRLIPCIILLLDIFIFAELNLFYKSLILLLIPLIFKTSIFILNDFSKKNKEYIEKEYLIIEANESRTGFYTDAHDEYKEILTEKQISTLSTTWVAYLATCMFIDKIYEYDSLYKKYIELSCYFLYTIAWGFILLAYVVTY